MHRAANGIEQVNIMDKNITANKDPEMPRLSRAQREIWIAQHVDPTNPKYNIAEYFEIRGPIDRPLFEAALRQVVTEAETLNYRFDEYEGGLRQIFDPVFDWSIPTVDVSTEADPRIAAETWMKEDLIRPAEVTKRPLFAFALFKAASDRYFWYLRFHHIIMDGFSRAIFAQRVAEVYTGLITGFSEDARRFEPLTSHLEDEKDYLESPQFKEDRKYWFERFADEPSPTSFSPALAGAAATGQFLRETIYLVPSMLNKLDRVANSAGATWRQAVIAAVAVYAYRITGASGIILTLPVHARIGPLSRRIPGMLSNALPLRLTLHSSMTLSDLVQQVSTELRQLLHHQRYRGADLRSDLRLNGAGLRMAGPVVNIMAFDYDLCFGGHSTKAFNLSNGPVDDLSVSVYERFDGRGLRLDLDANPTLYTADDLARHHRQFQRLLFDVIAAVPAQPIGSLNLLEAAERRQILVDWNAAAHPVPETTFPVLFEQQVDRSPDAVALMFEGTPVSYHELNVRANRLAHHLTKIGVGPESIVAVALERSTETISSILAIMKAGAAYLPLDPDYPAGRLSFMIQDAKPVCIVTNATITAWLPNHLPHLVLDDPQTLAALDQSSIKNPTDQERVWPLTALNSAYVIYTSGSTGAPKGVVISHAGIPSLAFSQIKHLDFTPTASLLQLISVGFDVFFFDLCLTLLSGARLVLAPVRTPPGEKLAAFAARSGVTHLNLPAAALNMMSPDGLSTCLNLIVGGESSSHQVVEQWSKGRRMINAYGPTEATVCAAMSEPLSGSNVPPIGRPIWNTRLYVLDAGLEPVPIGVTGELYIAGMGLARGYLGHPGLTAERFIACPFGPPGARMYRSGDLVWWRPDGTLDFLGRADQQIKIRGFRIEPVEIESELTAIDGIAQAVVIAREIAGEIRLIAYLVGQSGKTLPAMGELRAGLAARLPDHMLPAAFIVLDALPLTINGKLDRRALPDPIITGQQNTYQPPGDAWEALLCKFFSELTGAAKVGLDDNFFYLGGSSLGAIKLIARVNKTFHCDLAVGTFFEQPTIGQLARMIHRREQERCLNKSAPFFDKGGNTSPVVFLFPGIYGDTPQLGGFRSSLAGRVHFVLINYPDLDEMAATAFDFKAIVDACVKQIKAAHCDAPVLLAGFSFGGCIAFETAQHLVRSHYHVAFLGLIDTPVGPAMRRSRIIPRGVISRYIQTLRSKRSIQDVLAVVYETFVFRFDGFIGGLVYRLPVPIARTVFFFFPVLNSRLALSFKRRLRAALRIQCWSQWSPHSLEIPTTLFQSDDPNQHAWFDFGWAKVCTCLTVVPVGGEHSTVLETPQREILADCFTRAIVSALQRS